MEVTKGFGIIGSLTPHVRQYRKRGTWGNHFLPVIEMFLIQWSSGKFVPQEACESSLLHFDPLLSLMNFNQRIIPRKKNCGTKHDFPLIEI